MLCQWLLFSFFHPLQLHHVYSQYPEPSSLLLDDVAQTNISGVASVIQKLIARRSRIEWVLFLVNLIFSSTFITLFAIALIINKDLQRIVFLFVTWALWLIGSTIFLFLRLSIGTYHFFRIALDLVAFVTMKALSKAFSSFQCAKYSFQKDPREQLLAELESSECFNEWLEIALQLDKLSGALNWRTRTESELYEWRGLAKQVSRLRIARLNNDECQLMFLLRLSSSRNFCGLSNPTLYSQALSGTKCLVEEFTEEVCLALKMICYGNSYNSETNHNKDVEAVNSGGRKIRNQVKNRKSETPTSNCETIDDSVELESKSNFSYSSSDHSKLDRPIAVDQSVVHRKRLGNSNCSLCHTTGLEELSEFHRDHNSSNNPFLIDKSKIRTIYYEAEPVNVQDRGIQTDDSIQFHGPANSRSRRFSPPRWTNGLHPIQAIPINYDRQIHGSEAGWCSSSSSISPSSHFEPLNGYSMNSSPSSLSSVGLCRHEIPSAAIEGRLQLPISMLEWEAENDYQLRDLYTPSPNSRFPASDPFPYLQRFVSLPQESILQERQRTKSEDHDNDGCNNSICKSSIWLKSRSGSDFKKVEETLKFLVTLRLSLGRTALCLSGGGSLAMYHMGIVRVLIEQQCLPRVISGTSGGSIVAGIISIYTDKELMDDILKPDIVQRYGVRWFPPVSLQLQRFFLKGQMMDGSQFEETCKHYFGNYTFKDAFLKTGRLVSIVVTPASRASGEALTLNHITTPDVFIWSAVTASCSLPGLLPPHELMVRGIDGTPVPYCPSGLKWMDGSISQDIPIRELASLFNVKQFIVSQVNPHHAPFVKDHTSGVLWMQSIENWLTLDIKNRYAKLAKFNLVPRIFGQNISSFWMLQVFEGHVTITPRASLIDWYRMVNQPSIEDMEDFFAKGQQRAWPHLPRIIQMMKIEKTLRQCWTDLTNEVRSRSMYISS